MTTVPCPQALGANPAAVAVPLADCLKLATGFITGHVAVITIGLTIADTYCIIRGRHPVTFFDHYCSPRGFRGSLFTCDLVSQCSSGHIGDVDPVLFGFISEVGGDANAH